MANEDRAESRTSLLVAAYRGRASAREGAFIDDPWAAALAGSEGLRLAEALDPIQPHMELFIAVRTAALDEAVRRHLDGACEEGVRQVVILGAGLDTRAARLAREGVAFFEVDHAGTQEAKLARLRALEGYPLEAATYVRCDFEREDFIERLTAAGFSTGAPALFLWEGVSYYLGEEAVRATLRRVAEACHPSSAIYFDFVSKRFIEGERVQREDAEARAFINDTGERLRFGVNDILPLLYEEGFGEVEVRSFDEACLRYTGSYDRARKFRFTHIARAGRARRP